MKIIQVKDDEFEDQRAVYAAKLIFTKEDTKHLNSISSCHNWEYVNNTNRVSKHIDLTGKQRSLCT
ncbi:hypothetical protein CHS0354_037886 [Potamilus streckersoni]|uniref:Uncharacterized protein n=1 Tax=Potamilus streckersoni TaxID=2493646 RepID=A0AAE0T9G7_9BIVA|nr:hypothetical protein CHS0354_037886 [Potamilus streckersoni]